MAEFKIGRLRFVWQGTWTTSTSYVKDDVVRFGGKTYVCLVGNTSGTFYTDLASGYWSLMADGFSYQGTWTTATSYKIGDVVRNGGQSYICVTGNTSGATFAGDSAYWNLLAGGISWRGTWTPATLYNVNDIIIFGAITFICTTANTSSSNFATDQSSYWTIFAQGTQFVNTWNNSTQYSADSIVTYGGYTYVSLQTNTGQVPPSSPSYWSVYTTGYSNQGTFSYGTTYKVGSVVQYGGNTYVAILDNTNQYPTNVTYWSIVAYGLNVRGTFSYGTQYNPNDIVVYGGTTYYALQANINVYPSALGSNWKVLSSGLSNRGTWSNSTNYFVNDLASYGANIYIATQDNTGQTPSTSASYWSVFNYGYNYAGTWTSSTAYKLGQVITFGGSLYQALSDNTNQTPGNVTITVTATTTGTNLITASSTTGLAANQPIVFASSVGNLVAGTTYYILSGFSGTQFQVSSTIGGTAFSLSTAGPVSISATQYGTTYWSKLSFGIKNRGTWVTSTSYNVDEIVIHGANVYISLIAHTSGTFSSDLSASKWQILASGLAWRNTWASSTVYYVNDLVVGPSGSVYIALQDNTSSGTFSTDLGAGYWQIFVQYNSFSPPSYSTPGTALTVASGGASLSWLNPTGSTNVLYVGPGGVDSVSGGYGTSLALPFASIRYACTQASSGYTIFVKSGTYNEFLPITVPAGVAVIGDNVRTTFVNPVSGTSVTTTVTQVSSTGNLITASSTASFIANAPITFSANLGNLVAGTVYYIVSGFGATTFQVSLTSGGSVFNPGTATGSISATQYGDLTGLIPNNQSTMFKLSDNTSLREMTFQNMTGWVPGGTANDITTSTPKGIYIGFNSGAITRPPSVSNCTTSTASGAIGAYLDGSVVTGLKTASFRYFNVQSDTGVGIWATNNARPEVITSATSYCYFSYAATNGGFIRLNNCKTNWGTYGLTSRGYLSSETAITGNVVGQQLNFTYNTGNINVGDTVTSVTSGGTATVIGVQLTQNKVFVTSATGTFNVNDLLTFTSGGTGTVTTGALSNQTGNSFTLNTLTAQPVAGSVITLNGTDSYVVQAVNGTWVNSSTVITILLASTTVTTYANSTSASFRSQTSVVKAEAHEFFYVGTGGVTNTNYPGTPLSGPTPANEIVQGLPGRVYYESINEYGNVKIGSYFNVNQQTGVATLNPAAFAITGASSLQLGAIGTLTGATITKFSTDGTLVNNSSLSVPTESAVKTYVDNGRTTTLLPNGFNLSSLTSIGIVEISNDGVNIVKIDQNLTATTRADSTFGTGTSYARAASARTIVIYPVSGQTSFTVWVSGIQYTYTSMITGTYASLNNLNYFFFGPSGIVSYTSGTIQDSYYESLALFAVATGTDSTNTFAVFSRKTLGINMPGTVHRYLINSTGAVYKTGLGVVGATSGATTYTNTVAGSTAVQELTHTFASLSTNYWLYNIAGVWTVGTADNNFGYLTGGTAQYNGSGALTTLTTGQYTVTYFIATSDKIRGGVMKLVGQKVFTSLAAARQSASTEPRDTSLVGLPNMDFVWIGAVVINSTGAVQTLDNGTTYIDLRYQIINGGVNSLGYHLVNAAASDIYYNNATSGLAATNVQTAIDAASSSLTRARSTLSLNTLWTNAW